MEETILVKETSIEEAEKVHATIPEFDPGYLQKFLRKKYNETKHLILVARINQDAAGYLIAYDRFNDGSIYCWCFGVKPKYRKKGVLTKLMQELEKWSRKNKFTAIKAKTENRFKAALSYYIENNYQVIGLDKKEKIEHSEIWMEKKLERQK